MEFVKYIPAKSIISGYKDDNQWFGINYNMNLYRGCCHGCIYCDSRSECYQIENFDLVRGKDNAINLIKQELQSKRKKGVVGTGAMSDPYNPFESKELLTRKALEQVNHYKYGISIITKSPLITRDIDILKQIQHNAPTIIKMTITTYDDELCKKIEPNVAPSSERFEAVKELSKNGIYTGILLMPILPFINDSEENIRTIVRKSAECGAKFVFVYGFGVTLRDVQRDYYFNQLKRIFPTTNLVQQYIKTYGNRYMNESIHSDYLWKIFEEECEKNNLLYKMSDIIQDYKNPFYGTQLSLF